ncbi:MAG: hypothetical protein J0M15_05380 [Deltaproteobacteria bacterium]|nr:hypothetical protein [Deltaproteobacteria bacterium]
MRLFSLRQTNLYLIAILFCSDVFCAKVSEMYNLNIRSNLSAQFKRTNALFGMVVGKDTVPISKPILRPFTSDGCSLSPNSFFEVDFTECCVEHDVAYWLGGSKDEKDKSDVQLKACIQSKLNSTFNNDISATVAQTYFFGVQMGGVNFLPNSFRWGYGWNFLRPYTGLTSEELSQAEIFYGKNLGQLWQKLKFDGFKIELQLYTLENSLVTILPSDKAIYNYLKLVMNRKDIIIFGKHLRIDLDAVVYEIKLESCPKAKIKITLNTQELIKSKNDDAYLENSTVLIDKIIKSVEDPDKCLKLQF